MRGAVTLILGLLTAPALTAGAAGPDHALAISARADLSGTHKGGDHRWSATRSDHLFDARKGRFWSDIQVEDVDERIPYAFRLDPGDYVNVQLVGGLYLRDDPLGMSWEQSYGAVRDEHGTLLRGKKHSSAIAVVGRKSSGTLTIDGARIHNPHDGVSSVQGSGLGRVLVVRNTYMTHVRDDAVENDSWHNVVIQDNLVDGAFVFYSSRAGSSYDGPDRDDERLAVLRDNIVKLKAMPGDPERSDGRGGPGHGKLFKLTSEGGSDPELILQGNIFVVEDANVDPLAISDDALVISEKNTLIWMGRGRYPHAVPRGFSLVEHDDGLFRRARSDWLSERGWSEGELERDPALAEPDAGSIVMGGGDDAELVASPDGSVLVGGAGGNLLAGGVGEDVLFAGPGHGPNILRSGPGRAFMIGGQDAPDRFVLESIDQEMIYIWGLSAGDSLELSGILSGYRPGSGDLERHLQIRPVGEDAILMVDRAGEGSEFRPLVHIAGGASLDLPTLASQLVID